MNSVQFNEIDLNLDGVNDLITFDRSGNKLNTFKKKNNEYIFAPKFRKLSKNQRLVFDCRLQL